MTPELAPTRGDFRFPRRRRIVRSSDFELIFKEGRRASDGCLKIWARANDVGDARLGLVVGKRCGNAVRRNRLKRLLREAFRLSRPRLPLLDYVCAPIPGVTLTLSSATHSLLSLAQRIADRMPR